METTSSGCLQPSELGHTTRSSSTTGGLGMKWEEGSPYCSPTTNTSPLCTLPQCRMMGLSTNELESLVEEGEHQYPKPTHATGSTVKSAASSPMQLASTGMHVKGVDRQVTGKQRVERVPEAEVFSMRPKYLQYNLWSPTTDLMVTAAEWMLSVQPLPRPPQNEVENLAAVETIERHPSLFKIVTPIKVGFLQSLLASHPNCAFVESVIEGL